MRVTRLEIFGFKSFVDRFVLNFDHNMIGIVGPNGCGKSNVVDALRWVLGETHAKHLRGGSFEDLIFNGSETRRQLGMAEVSLTIRPESNWKERVEQQSGSLEEIDQEKEELESLASTLDSFEEEPVAVEEDTSHLNVLSDKVMSIPGLFEATEIQFTRRLYRSGESEYLINRIPCRLRDMQDLYRMIGLGARGLSIVQQGTIGQFISKKPLERRELLEEAAGISGFRAKMEAAIRRLGRTNDNLARVSDILIEIEKQVRSLKRQANRARARQDLKDELKALEYGLFVLRSRRLGNSGDEAHKEIAKIQEELDLVLAEAEKYEAQIVECDAEIHDDEVQILALRRNKDEKARELLSREQQLQSVRVKLAACETKRGHLSDERSRITERLESISAERGEYESDITHSESKISAQDEILGSIGEKLKALEEDHQKQITDFINAQSSVDSGPDFEQFAKVSSDIESCNTKIETLESKLFSSGSIHERLNSQKRAVQEKEKSVHRVERDLIKVQSETEAIAAQLGSLARHAAQAASHNVADARVLASVLTVPEQFQTAVSAVLGDTSQYLLSKESDSLLHSYMDGSEHGKRIGVLDASRAGVLDEKDLPSGIKRISDCLSVESEYASAVEAFLQHCYYAESRSDAISFKDQMRSSGAPYSIVLTGGEVLTEWGWYSATGEGVELALKRREGELEERGEELERALAQVRSDLEAEQEKLSSIQIEADELNRLRSELSIEQRNLSTLLRAQTDIEKRISSEKRAREEELRSTLRESERAVLRELSEAQDVLSELKVERSILDNRIKQLATEEEQSGNRVEEIASELDRLSSEQEQLQAAALAQAEDSASDYTQEIRQGIAALETEISGREDARVEKQKTLGDAKYELSQCRQKASGLEGQKREQESVVERSQIESEMLEQDFQRYYPEEDAPQLVKTFELAEDSVEQELQKDAQALRKRLEREGEVDPQSIELYEEESKRFEDLQKQSAELHSAKEVLERTIKQLRELSKVRFVKTFHAVNEQFKVLIPRLFAGGAGHLELVNPDDPLNSGVEIVVRPPGKKITTMELMSGGEKALVATAVLVAMFLNHPGPICVMDEVDAPLDDANLGRFLDLLSEIASKTQFLIITHNKITMQAVDRLIGITMQESGVTTALSVSLDQAEQALEKAVVNG